MIYKLGRFDAGSVYASARVQELAARKGIWPRDTIDHQYMYFTIDIPPDLMWLTTQEWYSNYYDYPLMSFNEAWEYIRQLPDRAHHA